MKIVYCIHSTFNSGGMERVLSNKANYLANKGYDITIITTEQNKKKSFFHLNESIHIIDLEIKYSDDNGKNIFQKGYNYLKKKRQHKKKLSNILLNLRPDITISMFGNEASFLPNIKDGSKKIAEIHFSKLFRFQLHRKGLWKLIDWYRSKEDNYIAKRFDRFICLTNEDKEHWKGFKNIIVIPNFIIEFPQEQSKLENKQVVAIGRLSYQKGFDRLIQAWEIIASKVPEWKLKIYGSGELQHTLHEQIQNKKLSHCITIHNPTNQISDIYINSSIFVLSSHYEGLPMVLLEALSYGLPIVSFTCKCGPKDLVSDGIEGFLVEEGNIKELANKLLIIINNYELRKRMGRNCLNKAALYTENKIMDKWENLFLSLTYNYSK